MRNISKIVLGVSFLGLMACSDYLNVVPDNIPTIDHAFNNRVSAEKYLFTCYSYIPDPTNPNNTQQLMSGNECWVDAYGSGSGSAENWFGGFNAFNVARGYQNSNEPLLNYWEGEKGGNNLFVGIRDCNIFLENIDKPVDLEEYEKVRWVAEAKFLKAYYHYFMLRTYGPVPIIDKNLPVSSTPEEVKVYREPVDDVINYIVSLLDEAAAGLPLMIQNEMQEMGRATQPMALALKAKVLILAASPLFNGNTDYANRKDNRGISLFSQTYDVNKWKVAAKAIEEAIESAHTAGHELYYFRGFNPVTDSTRMKMNIRGAVTERWNKEIIWGSLKDDQKLQRVCCLRTNISQAGSDDALSMMSPTLDVAEMFYTNNGVPIGEDKNWDYENRYKTSVAQDADKYFIKTGYETANLHFKRESRFYGSLSFDGCIQYGNGIIDDKDPRIGYAQMKKGQPGGMMGTVRWSITGYLPKKLLNYETVLAENMGRLTSKRYSFPMIRLGDLYLMLAEALNETKSAPDNDVYKWIDLVRERASLPGVVESWTKYSKNPAKPTTQAGMREIIHQERMIELAFEGERYWDLLRWKEAEIYMNRPIKGWNVKGKETKDYYEVVTIFQPEFMMKNYLAPLKKYSLNVNSNLVQNPGW